MRRFTGTMMLAFALLGGAAVASAESLPGPPPPEITRAEYVAQVEPICKRNTAQNKRILSGARQKVSRGKMPAAGAQFTRAAAAFGKAIKSIKSVPRPAADDARLVKWFGFLQIVEKNLRKIGVALKKEDRVKANHEAIRAERSGNAANNVGSVFRFLHCHLQSSRFR